MAKLFGVFVIVVGVWIGMTVYIEGADRAFWGIFARFSQPSASSDSRAPLERIRDEVEDARDAQLERIERQLDSRRADSG